MPECAHFDTSSGLVIRDSGVADLSACVLVIETRDDYVNGAHYLANLSIDDAAVISGHIGLVWAIAWGARAVAKALDVGRSQVEDD